MPEEAPQMLCEQHLWRSQLVLGLETCRHVQLVRWAGTAVHLMSARMLCLSSGRTALLPLILLQCGHRTS